MLKKIVPIIILLLPLLALGINQMNVDTIHEHYSAQPFLYNFDSVPVEHISNLIERQYVLGSQSMLVRWQLKKGAIIASHAHASEQITWITKGSVKVISANETYIIKAGQVIVFPPYLPHEFHALDDTIDIDYFTPIREDWLSGSATYLNNSR